MGLPVTVALLCHELESEARLQGAALELSLPVARISGLALPGCEATGGGALSGVPGVVHCLTAYSAGHRLTPCSV